jgi:hypothetical protein
MSGRSKKQPRSNTTEHRMVRAIDELAEFEDFQQLVLPKLRKAVKEGWSAEKIYKEMSSLAAAKAVTHAMTAEDPAKALTAIKEILDRSQGKAVERREIKTKVEAMSDEELDSMLASEIDELKEVKKDGSRQH